MTKPEVCIVGGGMITQVQILPSIYHLQRQGRLGTIHVCALNSGPLRVLAEDATLRQGFPGHTFVAHPSLESDPGQNYPEMFAQVLEKLPPQSIVVVAVPDQLHYGIIMAALSKGHHVCTVKPLVLKYDQAVEIERLAYEKGLVVGVEYHKRMDDRALLARKEYRAGRFGEFRIGHAEMNEPYYYRHSNFQNWCTCENSDMFTYVGCHYVDQVQFITGLRPRAVSVYGIKDRYPNGREGFLFTDARVLWENDACLHVTDVMGYPDDGPGGNFQGLRLYCNGKNRAGMLVHNDQYRGMEYCYVEKYGDGDGKYYHEPSPDYFKFIDLGDGGLTPVGYGYRSIELIVRNIEKALALGGDLPARQRWLKQLDEAGIMATPANSAYNELVMEAGRLSILNQGRMAEIIYGDKPGVKLI